MPGTGDSNTAVAAVERVVHSGPNPPVALHGERLLTGERTMLSREGLGGLARDTFIDIGPAVFVKDYGDHWKRGFEGFPLGSSKTDHVFHMMANAPR